MVTAGQATLTIQQIHEGLRSPVSDDLARLVVGAIARADGFSGYEEAQEAERKGTWPTQDAVGRKYPLSMHYFHSRRTKTPHQFGVIRFGLSWPLPWIDGVQRPSFKHMWPFPRWIRIPVEESMSRSIHRVVVFDWVQPQGEPKYSPWGELWPNAEPREQFTLRGDWFGCEYGAKWARPRPHREPPPLCFDDR